MTALVWDKVEDRRFETGLDRGVLYPRNGSGVAWSGLVDISENSNQDTSTVYYDGRKISHFVSCGDYTATLKAYTYPDEFEALQGTLEVFLAEGMFASEQTPIHFGLCYRTMIGGSLTGELGYKVHIIYNAWATPSDKTFHTISDSAEFTEFQWNISALPYDVPSMRPSAHVILDSRKISPPILEEIEQTLYGSNGVDPYIISPSDLADFISEFPEIRFYDNGDGTFTAKETVPGHFSVDDNGIFTISDVSPVYSGGGTIYTVNDVP